MSTRADLVARGLLPAGSGDGPPDVYRARLHEQDGRFRGHRATAHYRTRCRVCARRIQAGEVALHSPTEQGMAHVGCGETLP